MKSNRLAHSDEADKAAEPLRLLYSFARETGVALMAEPGVVAVREGAQPQHILEARRIAGRPLARRAYTAAAYDQLLSELYHRKDMGADVARETNTSDSDLKEAADLLDSGDDAPVIRLINSLIAEAVKNRGSDIHIEPFETTLSIRQRVDGILTDLLSLPGHVAPQLVSRIKVMARLDIAEKRVPQDGRISLTLAGRALDVRVSTLPSKHGERVVLRLLDRAQASFSVAELGMTTDMEQKFRKLLGEPNGILLVTGPTGAGKTTSLYAGLSHINDKSRNILTVEDPVEYALDGVGQSQVNPRVGMTFAAGLRAILRQDPDVVMVGEIRDLETAEIAVQASLTGHLVLSTVHTNSAAGAVVRLRDMGVEAFLIASTLKGVLAQRLVRKLCTHCREAYAPDPGLAKAIGLQPENGIYRAKGCDHCSHTGYAGRTGIYELITVDSRVAALIHEDAQEGEISRAGLNGGETLQSAGVRLVRDGITSVDELVRVVGLPGADKDETHAGL